MVRAKGLRSGFSPEFELEAVRRMAARQANGISLAQLVRELDIRPVSFALVCGYLSLREICRALSLVERYTFAPELHHMHVHSHLLLTPRNPHRGLLELAPGI